MLIFLYYINLLPITPTRLVLVSPWEVTRVERGACLGRLCVQAAWGVVVLQIAPPCISFLNLLLSSSCSCSYPMHLNGRWTSCSCVSHTALIYNKYSTNTYWTNGWTSGTQPNFPTVCFFPPHYLLHASPVIYHISSKVKFGWTSWCPHRRDASCLVWMRIVWLDIWDLHRMQSAWSCCQYMFKPMKEGKDRRWVLLYCQQLFKEPIPTLQGSSRN